MARFTAAATVVIVVVIISCCGTATARAEQPLGRPRDRSKRRVRARPFQVPRNAGAVAHLGAKSQRGRIGITFGLHHSQTFIDACIFSSWLWVS